MILKFAILLLIGLNIRFSQADGLNVFVQDLPETTQETIVETNTVLSADELCAQLNCEQGEYCDFSSGEPACACIEDCESPDDERHKICTTSNQTFDSECHFYREKCWCRKGDNKCQNPSISLDALEYFGECQDIPSCSEEQKSVFPERIKVWLDEVLHILNDRHDIDTTKYGDLVDLALKRKKSQTERYWTYGVVFEFCQLDKSHDGVIEADELTALVAPIKALESCIQPFLNTCDTDNDSNITDSEWAKCLDLSEDDLLLLRKTCEQ